MRFLAFALLLGVAVGAPLAVQADGRAPGCEPSKPHGKRYIVAFDTGSSSIRPADREKIDAAAKWSKDRFIRKICLLAYADPRGSVESNRALSLKRAAAVEAALTRRGVSASMERHALGEAPGGFLGLISDDEQEDRRVEIVLVR